MKKCPKTNNNHCLCQQQAAHTQASVRTNTHTNTHGTRARAHRQRHRQAVCKGCWWRDHWEYVHNLHMASFFDTNEANQSGAHSNRVVIGRVEWLWRWWLWDADSEPMRVEEEDAGVVLCYGMKWVVPCWLRTLVPFSGTAVWQC